MSNEAYEIPLECIIDEAYSDCPDFNVDTDGCKGCEFLIEDDVHCIGGQLFGIMGTRLRCEKGYFKEEV